MCVCIHRYGGGICACVYIDMEGASGGVGNT
jgi:hypothetical protein